MKSFEMALNVPVHAVIIQACFVKKKLDWVVCEVETSSNRAFC